MYKSKLHFLWAMMALLTMASCNNVEDGYRIDYPESDAVLSIGLLTPDRGKVGDTISFTIDASANSDIKSLVVISSQTGGNGTEYVISPSQTDPLIDHSYGTMQPNTRGFAIKYNYVMAMESGNVLLTFRLIDGNGQKSFSQSLLTVPAVSKYSNVALYTQSSSLADGFSTKDGAVYPDLSSYEALTSLNMAVQQSLDVVFLVVNDTAVLIAPYNGFFQSSLQIRNKTLFKKLTGVTSADFDKMTAAKLSAITEEQEVKKGSTLLWNVKVGDIVGFRTDLDSSNPYHFGMLRINAMHPTNAKHYSGVSYLVRMDVVVQNK
jgi:hypothetical protein